MNGISDVCVCARTQSFVRMFDLPPPVFRHELVSHSSPIYPTCPVMHMHVSNSYFFSPSRVFCVSLFAFFSRLSFSPCAQDVQVMNFSLAPPDGGPELIKNADLLLGTVAWGCLDAGGYNHTQPSETVANSPSNMPFFTKHTHTTILFAQENCECTVSTPISLLSV
jgi:hypothetical protein